MKYTRVEEALTSRKLLERQSTSVDVKNQPEGRIGMKVKSESEVAQSCPTLCDPMDCSPPGSSFHGIFQARVLEWGAIAFSVNGF